MCLRISCDELHHSLCDHKTDSVRWEAFGVTMHAWTKTIVGEARFEVFKPLCRDGVHKKESFLHTFCPLCQKIVYDFWRLSDGRRTVSLLVNVNALSPVQV